MAKAWLYTDDDYANIVYADTRGKARRKIADEEGIEFTEAKVYRLPWADKYGHYENIPEEVLFENGWRRVL